MKKPFLLILSLLIFQSSCSNIILNKIFENKRLFVISSIAAFITYKTIHNILKKGYEGQIAKANFKPVKPNNRRGRNKSGAKASKNAIRLVKGNLPLKAPKLKPDTKRVKDLNRILTNFTNKAARNYAILATLGATTGICLLVSKIYNSKNV